MSETTVHAVSFNRATKTTHAFALADLERELQNAEVYSWIDIRGPDISVLNDTLRRLRLDLVLVSQFDEPEKLLFVLGQDFVVTYHRNELDVVSDVRAKAPESFRLFGRSPGFIAFLILQRCLYDYAHLNLANDNFLDGLEGDVLKGDPQLGESIAVAGHNILTLKKLLASLHIVLMLLATKRSVFITDESRPFYHEMLVNTVAVRDAVDSSRDLLDGIVGSVQARAAQRTGDIARVLTVVSAIILPLTLIAGIYGMNFEFIPELRLRSGYFVVLGTMLAIVAALLLVFWRLGWFASGGGGSVARTPRRELGKTARR